MEVPSKLDMKNVAIVGTVGVPANYGGFESLVENLIGERSAGQVRYTVFCSSKAYSTKIKTYKSATLKYIPLNANGVQSILYDIISIVWATFLSDVILVLGVSGCCCLPIYRLFFPGKRLIINIDGLEHRRDKWGKWTRRFLKFSEKMAVKYADKIIADNKGIQDYVKEEYGKQSELIAYGGDHAIEEQPSVEEQNAVLVKYGLEGKDYAISVCRIEPENNCHVILEAFAQSNMQIVYIGNWNRSEYGIALKEKYQDYKNILLLDPIYDIHTLYALRANTSLYVHGHSAGGTNPSLVEAMFFGVPIVAYDVVYNRETTHGKAYFFSNEKELRAIINNRDLDFEQNAQAMSALANEYYTWQKIAESYEQLY